MQTQIRVVERLEDISANAWNRLTDNPFVSHEFLSGLERHDCLTAHGWFPRHLIAEDDSGLLGAMPLYVKNNSYGEFVFDWSWAEAYEQANLQYYPKLVSAVPYTPSTGSRLLVSPDLTCSLQEQIRKDLVRTACAWAKDAKLSSWHCLFFPDSEWPDSLPVIRRYGCQYHWFNRDYRDFDDFLDNLNSKRRKQIKRERKAVRDSGITINVLTGEDIQPEHWQVFHEFYCSTFARKWGRPRLSLAFFQNLMLSPPNKPVLLLARRGEKYLAGAFALLGLTALYGRHWGCTEDVPFLHFELCYYQTIDYCIRHQLASLDAGAQGEHKLSRGFEPVLTHSAHWISDARFAQAIAAFTERERVQLDMYIRAIQEHTPYHSARTGSTASEGKASV